MSYDRTRRVWAQRRRQIPIGPPQHVNRARWISIEVFSSYFTWQSGRLMMVTIFALSTGELFAEHYTAGNTPHRALVRVHHAPRKDRV